MALFDKAEIQERVQTLWQEIFAASSKVLRDSRIYSFSLMEEFPEPNIHTMLLTLRVLDEMMELIVVADGSLLEYDDMRRLLNAREQVRRMERVALAIKMDDEEAYSEALRALDRQADF